MLEKIIRYGKGHVDAVKLLLDREVKMNAKDSVRKRSYMLMFYFYMKLNHTGIDYVHYAEYL